MENQEEIMRLRAMGVEELFDNDGMGRPDGPEKHAVMAVGLYSKWRRRHRLRCVRSRGRR